MTTAIVTFATLNGPCSVRAEVVSTEAEHRKGLSGRESLNPDDGMLFDLGEVESVTFGMKGMLFSIDIIFIADDVVTKVVHNLSPKVLAGVGGKFVKQVLEVNAGWCERNGVEVGTQCWVLY